MTDHFVVEFAPPSSGWLTLRELAEGARRTAEDMSAEGTPVRFLRSIFVPEDDTCFFLYRARTREIVHEAARRAELGPTQIQPTISPESEVPR